MKGLFQCPPRATPWVVMGANLSPCKGKSFKRIRQFTKLLPLQGALLTVIIPRALPWAKSFCPFRACCLYERAAYMSFCPFRACCLYELLPLLGVLLLKLTSSVLYS